MKVYFMDNFNLGNFDEGNLEQVNENNLLRLNNINKIADLNNTDKETHYYIIAKMLDHFKDEELCANDIFVTGDLNTKYGLPAVLPYIKGLRQFFFSRLLRYETAEAINHVEDNNIAREDYIPQQPVPPQGLVNLADLDIDHDILMGSGRLLIEEFGLKIRHERIQPHFIDAVYDLPNLTQQFEQNLLGENNTFFDEHGVVENLRQVDNLIDDKTKESENENPLIMAKALNIDTHFNLFKNHHLSVLRLLYRTFPSSTLQEYGNDIRTALIEAYKVYKDFIIFNQDGTGVDIFNREGTDREVKERWKLYVELIQTNIPEDTIYPLSSYPYYNYSLLRKNNFTQFLEIFQTKLQQHQQLPDDILEKNYIFSDSNWNDMLLSFGNTRVNYNNVYSTFNDYLERNLSIPEILDQFALSYMKRIDDPVNVAETLEQKTDVLIDMCLTKLIEFSPEVSQEFIDTLLDLNHFDVIMSL